MLRPTNLTYNNIRVWLETDDVGMPAHMQYRVRNKQCSLVVNESLEDVDAVDNGVTAPVVEKKVVKITARYSCANCKAQFEQAKLAGRAKACPHCGMATVIDHTAKPQEAVPVHWSDGINASAEEKAIMRQYMTSKDYMERPAQHLEMTQTKEPTGDELEPVSNFPPQVQTRYVCNQCEKEFDRSTIVNKKKTCRECGSDDITDRTVTDVTEQ